MREHEKSARVSVGLSADCSTPVNEYNTLFLVCECEFQLNLYFCIFIPAVHEYL